MSYLESTRSKFDTDDNEFSVFAKALALPIRVAIIRMILEHDNNIRKEELLGLSVNHEVVTKHIAELRTLKIVIQSGMKGNIRYRVDHHLFKRMTSRFNQLFSGIDQLLSDEQGTADQQINETHHKTEKQLFSNFGDFIHFHRTDLNMSQETLAMKLCLDRSQLSRIESGKKDFDIQKLKLLSKALYIDLASLKKEYYSFKIADLADESGFKDSILDSAKEKLR